MKQKLLNNFKLRATLLVAMLCAAFTGAWADDITYTFTSKAWADSESAWTSGKDGNAFQDGRGVQVTAGATGANATSIYEFIKISKIVVTYSTNASKGAGDVSIQIGSNEATSQSVTKTGGTSDRTLEYIYDTPQTGVVNITVACSENSIYIKSIAITLYSGGDTPTPTLDCDLALTESVPYLVFDLYDNASPQVIYYTTSSTGAVTIDDSEYATFDIDEENKTITVTPIAKTPEETQLIYVHQAADENYKAGSAVFNLIIDNTGPSISVAETTINAPAEGTDDMVALTYENFGITDASQFEVQFYDSEENEIDAPDWMYVEVMEDEGYVVFYSIDENTSSEPRTAYFKVYAMGDQDHLIYSDLVTVSQAVSTPKYNVTWSVNGATNIESYEEGADIIFPADPADVNGKTFVGWVTTAIDGTTSEAPTFVTSATMAQGDLTYFAVFAYANGGGSSEFVDALNRELTDVSGTNYASWTGKTATSTAVYAGNSAGGNDAIQLRSNNSNSGIVTTTSGGKAKKVVITWNDKTAATRTVSIYGKNSAYAVASDLYSSATQGTLLGELDIDDASGLTSELTISEDIEYIGIRSKSGALYLDEVAITWSTGGGVSYSDYCTTVVAAAVARPTIEVAANPFTFSTTATITCETEGAAIKYSFDGETWNDYFEDLTITETTTLYAKAVKDENDSEVASVTITKNLAVPTVTIDATGITNTNVYDGTEAGSLAAAVTYNDAAVEGAAITWSGNNDEVATIDASTGAVILVAAGTVTFTATYAGNEDYAEKTATYQMTVTNSDPNAPGTENNPYTVADAITFIGTLGSATSATEVYVSGIISQVDSYNSKYSSITYWISDDGTTEGQMEVYSGKGLNGEGFSAKEDLQVGDIVTVKGYVKMYNSTPEFDKNNELVSFERPATPTITATPNSLTGFTYVFDNGPSAAQMITISYSNLTAGFRATLSDNSKFEMSVKEDGAYVSSDMDFGKGGTSWNVYVRMRSGLAIGEYDGFITITSEGVEDVIVSLAGSVTAPETSNVTWDLSTNSYDEVTNVNVVRWSSNYATMTNSSDYDGGGTEASSYLGGDVNNRTSSRFHNGNTLTITPGLGYEITLVVFEATSIDDASVLQYLSLWTNATAIVNGQTVTVTPTDGTTDISAIIGGTCGFTSVKVYYQDLLGYPSITLPLYEIEVNADGGNAEIPVTCSNLADEPQLAVVFVEADGETLATYDHSWITAEINSNGNIDGHMDVNTGDARTAYFRVSGVDANNNTVYSELVTISQGAYTGPSITTSKSSLDFDAGSGERTLSIEYTGLGSNPSFDVQFFESDETTPTTCDWITSSFATNDNKVTITVAANTGDARTAYFKVYAVVNETTIYSDLVTVNQDAPAAPVVDYATLPFSFNGGKGDIESQTGLTHTGLGTDYSDKTAPTTRLKFDSANDELVLKLNEAPTMLTFDIKGNGFSGGTFTVQTSSDGEKYSDLETYTDLGDTQSESFNLDENVRYIKWIYTNKVNGNVGLGNIIVTAPITVTLNAYGYATFASEFALDFVDVEPAGFSAWAVSEISGETINFTQVTDQVEAGTGVLLKGESGAIVTINRVASGMPVENLLVGITEETPVEADQYYGLKGDQFQKVNAGTIPAGKALLPASSLTAGVKAFTFIFNDADGIQTVQTVSAEAAQAVFNLAGQRLPKAQKGINIINGKKVLVK